MIRKRLFACIFLVTLSLSSGFVSVDSFPEPFNTEPDKTANPPSPEEALAMWNLPEGFSINLYSAEPDVQNPIGMAWDHRGRMWVAENYTYAERATRFELSLKDRILILSDTDGDGKADERKVFHEDLQRLTSVEVGHGGIWAMCPPQLLFIPDQNGDDVPDDSPVVVLDGFTVAQSNYHNFANGLRWGPDGWLYGRCGHSCPGKVGVPGAPDSERIPIKGGVWRFHPERVVFEMLTHGTTNPWGHDWDRNGQLFFINTVNGHLWHGIHGAHFPESFGADPNPFVYERIDTHADHYHYDTSGKWSESRDGAANDYGGGHAHIGMMIYQGQTWPERFHDRLFTVNMHGRRTNVERLERVGSGFVGRHEPDIFLMDDTWYRGIDIQPGPDGAVYIIDWSDTGECHEHTGVHRTSGRIYRIQYGKESRSNFSGLDKFSVATMTRMNGDDPWFDRQMWGAGERLQVTEEGTIALNAVLLDADLPTEQRLRALWALGRSGEPFPYWSRLINDPDENIRAWTIRQLAEGNDLDTIVGPLATGRRDPLPESVFTAMLKRAEIDVSGLVRLELASTLQRLDFDQRSELGLALASRKEDAADHNLPSMVWFGVSPLAREDPDGLIKIAKETSWPTLLRWIARSVSSQLDENPEVVNSLLSTCAELPTESQSAILKGIEDGLKGWRKAPKPEAWDNLVDAMSGIEDAEVKDRIAALSVLFGDGRALDEVKALALDTNADHAMRRAALLTLIENRPDDLRAICESLLKDRLLNATAVKGLVLFDDPQLGQSIAKQYRRFSSDDKPSVLAALVSRSAWAGALLAEMESGKISKKELSAFQARQIQSFGDEELSGQLERVWGEVRDSNAEKRKLIEEWTEILSDEFLAEADLSQGRMLYAGICSACHRMYGNGGKIGPDLTGSNRGDLGYLLENIFDPGGVVSADYRMSIVEMSDGRTLTGVVESEDKKSLVLRQAVESVTLSKSEVVKREVSSVSMMPDGLLQPFSKEQVRDLIGYLRHPVQVALPK